MSLGHARSFKVLLTVLLVCITIFSVFKYLASLKERYTLLKSLNQAKGQIAELEDAIEKEKELERALSQENLSLKDELRSNADKLTELNIGLQNSQKAVEQLTSQITLAKAENTALREEKDNLALELALVSQERDTLKLQLSSIPELRKRIKEVKAQIRRAKVMMKEIAMQRRAIIGNRGYLIRNGEATYALSKVKIEVLPAPRSR